jgi:hypothetical protein
VGRQTDLDFLGRQHPELHSLRQPKRRHRVARERHRGTVASSHGLIRLTAGAHEHACRATLAECECVRARRGRSVSASTVPPLRALCACRACCVDCDQRVARPPALSAADSQPLRWKAPASTRAATLTVGTTRAEESLVCVPCPGQSNVLLAERARILEIEMQTFSLLACSTWPDDRGSAQSCSASTCVVMRACALHTVRGARRGRARTPCAGREVHDRGR